MRANTHAEPPQSDRTRLSWLLGLDRPTDLRFSGPDRHIYAGTVPAATVAKRRAKNRAARIARRIARRSAR